MSIDPLLCVCIYMHLGNIEKKIHMDLNPNRSLTFFLKKSQKNKKIKCYFIELIFSEFHLFEVFLKEYTQNHST